jgi:hypothetical protein
LQLLRCVGSSKAQVGRSCTQIRDLVAHLARTGFGPIHLRPRDAIGNVGGLADLVGQFNQRIAPLLGRRPSMRGAPLDRHRHGGCAGGGQQHALGRGHCLGSGGLVGQHHVMLFGDGGDGLARAGRLRLFVGIEQHGQLGVVLPAGGPQDA